MSSSRNLTLEWMAARAQERVKAGLRRSLRVRQADDPMLDLASNDYLGLACDPRVIEAAAEAVRTWGAGSTGSRLVTGTTAAHADLEASLASHVGTESGLVFSSGYLANLGAITSLCDEQTLIVSDSLNHASLIDGVRLTRSRVHIVGHRNVAAVEVALAERREPKAVVVTDAVFSVDGDIAPLARLHQVARAHGAMLVIDEAHSLGVIGDRGEGVAAAAGISGESDVVLTLTFSKSLGGQGGAVMGTRHLTDHVLDTARSFIFDTALAPPCVGSAAKALQVICEEPERVAAVRANAQTLQRIGREVNWQSHDANAAVISLIAGRPEAAVAAAATCAQNGVRVGCFRPPSVPDGVSRLRLTSRATLTPADFERAGVALQAAWNQLPGTLA